MRHTAKQSSNGVGACEPDCCPAKPALRARPLLSPDQASRLAGVFKVLANDSRLRLLHALAKSGELSVGALADAVAMKTQAVSNQLQRLQDLGILDSRRDGTSIFYRIVDPCAIALLDQGLCLMEDARQSRSRTNRISAKERVMLINRRRVMWSALAALLLAWIGGLADAPAPTAASVPAL
jgi:DNA-binding transcriptional ArsR family regulator